KGDEQEKPHEKVVEIANVIKEIAPDVIVLQEVEGRESIEKFNKEYLGGKYRVFIERGNDGRGIDVAMLVAADLDVDIKYETHKDATWHDPVENRDELVFSRDLPALIIYEKGAQIPAAVILGHHGKSKRDRPGDPESNVMRKGQVAKVNEIRKS